MKTITENLTPIAFPEFAIIHAQHAQLDDAAFHAIHSALSEISDRVYFVTPHFAIADLRGMAHYFKSSEHITQTFLTACQKRFSDPGIRFFIGNHLLRSLLFMQNDSHSGFHRLDSLHLHYRHVLRNLNWDQWLHGVSYFLSLYEQSTSTYESRCKELRQFVSCMQQMRFETPHAPLTAAQNGAGQELQLHSPQAARSHLGQSELERRFGRFVARVWKTFCHPHDWAHFEEHNLRQLNEPLDLGLFAAESTPMAGIALHECVPAILTTLQCVLDKLQAFSPLHPFGIKEFEIDFAFGSGHSIKKCVFLNEAFFDLERTARTIIEQSCAALLRPSAKQSEQSKQSKKSEDWSFISSPEGLALSHHDHPERIYFVSYIESLKIKPLRISDRPQCPDAGKLFTDERDTLALADISALRKELLVHHGQNSTHYIPIASLTRPYETRPLLQSHPIAPESNLFSHTFLLRPPAVFRRSLPLLPKRDLPSNTQVRFASSLVYLETVGRYDFFVWIDGDSDAAIWLGSLCAASDTPLIERHFECLGYFDSLRLLPDWVQQQKRYTRESLTQDQRF
jgi:hypothetical protein